MTVTILHGDCVEAMRDMEEDSIDSIVCDPPYELGFMGKKWDASGIAYSVEMWSEALRVLKPGGHLLAFGGTRTYHRMACAIEDAGFDIRDCLQWLYGSGFPKSMDVSKAIDKAAGATREVVGQRWEATRKPNTKEAGRFGEYGPDNGLLTAPATPEAEQWSGWGTALKPAYESIVWAEKPCTYAGVRDIADAVPNNEPIVLARKPLSEKTVAANVLTHGTGAINIDGCRVASDEDTSRKPYLVRDTPAGMGKGLAMGGNGHEAGRFPANVILSHSSACEPTKDASGTVSVVCADDCPIRMLDEQSGTITSGARSGIQGKGVEGIYGDYAGVDGKTYEASKGGASRFFYVAKASKRERNAGLEDSGNGHPTVKPVELMRYLIRMITPPGGVVLDPFAGSGTTGVAAIKEGVYCILIEREAEYLDIIEARIAHAS